ncbi:MAG TPA: DnaJ domain-containing protein [Chryseosolibacter sp.]|nr:DnaJ domain-containing protein [Chryseosolibacter sp.]
MRPRYDMKDFYAILNVSPAASEAEIKTAFRKLAVRYHPDKNRSPDAKSLFQEINEAYDILGDPQKRAAYDERRSNPLAGIIVEPVPTHRDPAYRRRRAYTPPRKKEPPPSYLLMRDYLKYVIWISRVGFVVSALFFLDFFLPYHQQDEVISEIYGVRYGRSIAYHVIRTAEGHEIKLYDFKAVRFRHERIVRTARTAVYQTVMYVSNTSGTYILKVGYMYRSLLWMPIILFVNSLSALLLRKRIELCFNLNITCFIWLVMNFILL